MADLPEPKAPPRKRVFNKDTLIGALYLIFVVAAIGGMMLIDYVGEKKMDRMTTANSTVSSHHQGSTLQQGIKVR
jgi:hypothetical protein